MKCYILLLIFILLSREIQSGDSNLALKSQRARHNGQYTKSWSSTVNDASCIFPWTYLSNNASCKCGDPMEHVIDCYNSHPRISSCYCVTYNAIERVTEVGSCVYNCGNPHNLTAAGTYFPVPSIVKLNEHMCGKLFNRTGTLCGKCIYNHFPLVYSFDMNCVKCPNGKYNWWKYVLVAFLPLTVFYFFILFFKINITSSNLYGVALFGQTICMPAMVRASLITTMNSPLAHKAVRYISFIYGIWNLDFLRSFSLGLCLGTTTLQTMAMDLAVGIYPILLMILSYVLIELHDRNFSPLVIAWKPFGTAFRLFRQNWEIRTSLIDAFSTFFLLSNLKFLSVAFDLLVPVEVHMLNSSGTLTRSWRLYYDATEPYFGETHLPYAILAIVVLLLFTGLPVLLLIIYPLSWFQKLLNLLPFRWYILHTFMDSFQGCYKDGTEPDTWDCRWFASVFFLARFIGLFIATYSPSIVFFSMTSIILVLLALMLIVIQPFKPAIIRYTYINATFILLLALFYTCLASNAIKVKELSLITFFLSVAMLTAIVPILYISIITLHWLYSHGRFGFRLINILKARRGGYEEIL